MAAHDQDQKEKKRSAPFFAVPGSGATASCSGMGGPGSLFSFKSGALWLLFGGTVVAVALGSVYDLIGPSSAPAVPPEPFQTNYFQEESDTARAERSRAREAAGAAVSSLEMFRQAKKDGLDGQTSGPSSTSDPAASAPAAGAGAENLSAGSEAAGLPRIIAAAGLSGSRGGSLSGTTIPKLRQGGGLSGGIGAQFKPVFRPAVRSGKGEAAGPAAVAGRASGAARPGNLGFSRKGAFAQARYAGKMGMKAAYSSDTSGARTAATGAFSGETGGSGNAGGVGSGVGLGGAGISNGAALKTSDPGLGINIHSIPEPSKPEDVSPWKKYEDMAMKFMLISIGLILLTKILGHFSKSWPPLYYAALAAAWAAIAAALVVIYAGLIMFSRYGQKLMGGIYCVVGALLVYNAWEALSGLEDPSLSSIQPAGEGVSKTGAANSLEMGGKNIAASTGGNVTGGTITGGNITTAGGATNLGGGTISGAGPGTGGVVNTSAVNPGTVVKGPIVP